MSDLCACGQQLSVMHTLHIADLCPVTKPEDGSQTLQTKRQSSLLIEERSDYSSREMIPAGCRNMLSNVM